MSLEGTFAQHLSPTQLGCLVDGFEGPAEAFKSLLHLRACRQCRVRLLTDFPTDGPELIHEFNLASKSNPLPAVDATSRGSRVEGGARVELDGLAESWASTAEAVANELLAAPHLANELGRVSPARQHLALEARRYQSLGFAIHLLRRCARLWNVCPTESRRLAELALALISKLEPGHYPAGLRADVQCKALAYLGNSLRLTGRLREAEERLTDAVDGFERATGNLQLKARVLELLAELHRDQRRFSPALVLVRDAKEIYKGLGEARQLARLVLVHASILAESGAAGLAIQELQALLTSIPRSVMGETIYWSARQNLCQTLVEDERLWEARCELKEVKRWTRRAGKPLMTARVLWVEALLTAREGDSSGAALRLGRVRDMFLRNHLPYDAALACLDLAALYLRRGQHEEAQGLAAVLVPVFQANGIHREALASLRLLASALEKKAATTAQVEELHRHLSCQR